MITTRATLGARAINTVPMTTNQGFKSLVFDDANSALFYYYVTDKFKSELKRRASGTTFLEVSGTEVAQIELLVPPVRERELIARILYTLDTTIRHAEAIIKKLKQVKCGLLHDLLTRGIDANGELRPPRSEAAGRYKGSSLGWIPTEWNTAPLIDHCSVITKGTTPPAGAMWQGNDGIRFLRVDNLLFDGQFDFQASNFRVSLATHNSVLARSRCLPGDVLTNIVGPPLGKVGLVTEAIGEVNINQAIAVFRPKHELAPQFLLLWLSSSLAQSWLRQRAKQTSGQVNLTLALCQELPLPCVPFSEQRAIIDRIESVQERINWETEELAKLCALKAGLADDLLTGRVRVTALLGPGAPA